MMLKFLSPLHPFVFLRVASWKKLITVQVVILSNQMTQQSVAQFRLEPR